MNSLVNIARVGVFGLGLVVAGCGDVDETPVGCDEVTNESPVNIINPVCGEDGVTYDSPLFACQEVEFYSPGICREIEECGSVTQEDALCPAIYDPVCGENGVKQWTKLILDHQKSSMTYCMSLNLLVVVLSPSLKTGGRRKL